MPNLAYLSQTKLDELRVNIAANTDRYRGTGFSDLTQEPGWSIAFRDEIDLSELRDLDGSDNRSETDLKNSRLVGRVLIKLTPTLANEERIWVRLSHVEGFEYSQSRWLRGVLNGPALETAIRLHFFAPSQTALRDDHALSRLWWNAFIARQCYPDDPDRGLSLLLTTSDVRSNLVERIWLMGRRNLASGVFRSMERDKYVLSSEKSFRSFMKMLNRLGGGIVFEAMSDSDIDTFLDRCSARAAAEFGA